MTSSRVFIAVFLAAMLFSGISFSENLAMKAFMKEFIPRYYHELPEDEFLQNSYLQKEEYEDKDYLSFEVRLPNGWGVAEEKSFDFGTDKEKKTQSKSATDHGSVDFGAEVFSLQAKYFSPPRMDYDSYFEVYTMPLGRGISLKNWYIDYLLRQGYTLEGLIQVNEKRIESLYARVEDGVPYFIRSAIMLNGASIIMVSHHSPEKYWMKERATQQRVLESFRLLNDIETIPEKVNTFKFLEILKFDYPISWQIKNPNVYSIDGMDALLINSDDGTTLKGEMKINIFSTELNDTLVDEINALKMDLQNRGLHVGELIAVPDAYDLSDHLFYDRVEVYHLEGDPGIQPHEYWLAILVEDRYFFIVSMLSPSRNTDFLTWARNIASYEVVLESIAPLD